MNIHFRIADGESDDSAAQGALSSSIVEIV